MELGISTFGEVTPDHVAGKIATPDVEKREDDGTSADRNQMDGSPAGQVGVGKNRDGDEDGEGGAAGKLAYLLDYVSAKEDFFHDSRAQNQQQATPQGTA